MIALDSNILIYAHRRDSIHHKEAASALTSLAEGRSAWAIPWPCLHEFFAIVTHRRVYSPPSTTKEAVDQIEAWLEAPTVVLLAESDRHWSELKLIVTGAKITGPRIHDARIAAICRQHGVRQLWSADRDFSRFSGFEVLNPLIG